MRAPRPLRLPSTLRYVTLGAVAVASAVACSSSSTSSGSPDAAADGKVADGSGDVSACPGAGFCGNLMDAAADAGCPDADVCSMADCPKTCTFI